MSRALDTQEVRNMKMIMRIGMGLALGISTMAFVPNIAMGQDIGQKEVSSLEYSQADVREALRSLFKDVNVSYSIAPDVQGQITVSLKKVGLEVALQNILRQVDATYRIEAGVFNIVRKQEAVIIEPGEVSPGLPSKDTKIVRRIKIHAADPYMIAALIGAKKGSQNYTMAPETSTINGLRSTGFGGQTGGTGVGNSGLGSGSGSALGGGANSGSRGGFGF